MVLPTDTFTVPDARDTAPRISNGTLPSSFSWTARARRTSDSDFARAAATVAGTCAASTASARIGIRLPAALMTVETIPHDSTRNSLFCAPAMDGTHAATDVAGADRLELRPIGGSERAAFRTLGLRRRLDARIGQVIVPGAGIASSEVLDLITRVAEHSLAAVQAESGRYRMLDTVRHSPLSACNSRPTR